MIGIMPRTKEDNEALRATQQAHILDAARHVFARRGWSATMSDIAEYAGISQGLAYRYFDGKESLYYALIEELQKPEMVTPFLDEKRSPYERLRLLVARILEVRGEYMEYYQLLVNTLQDDRVPATLRSAIQDYGERFGGFLRHLIITGQAAGEVAEGDPKQLESALRGCLNGLSKMAVVGQLTQQADFPTPDIVLRLIRK